MEAGTTGGQVRTDKLRTAAHRRTMGRSTRAEFSSGPQDRKNSANPHARKRDGRKRRPSKRSGGKPIARLGQRHHVVVLKCCTERRMLREFGVGCAYIETNFVHHQFINIANIVKMSTPESSISDVSKYPSATRKSCTVSNRNQQCPFCSIFSSCT